MSSVKCLSWAAWAKHVLKGDTWIISVVNETSAVAHGICWLCLKHPNLSLLARKSKHFCMDIANHKTIKKKKSQSHFPFHWQWHLSVKAAWLAQCWLQLWVLQRLKAYFVLPWLWKSCPWRAHQHQLNIIWVALAWVLNVLVSPWMVSSQLQHQFGNAVSSVSSVRY